MQSRRKHTEHADRLIGVQQIVCNVRVIPQRFARAHVGAVTLFGDSQRYDFCLRASDARDHRRHPLGREQHLAHAADCSPRITRLRHATHRVQAVLRRELVAHRRRFEAYATDAPIAARMRHRRVGVHRLMGAVKCADAEVNDADAYLCGIVGGALNIRWKRED